MIRIDRNRVPSPIAPHLLAEFHDGAEAYYAQDPVARAQRRIETDRLWRMVRPSLNEALLELFNNKCAYCETSLAAGIDSDRFRPVSGASDLDGRASPDHYGWLAFDWANIFASCAACNRAKRSLFPVDGLRAEPLMPIWEVVRRENALLLDPCMDEPEEHLEFIGDGSVRALSPRGEATIKVLNLNRGPLRNARRLIHQLVTAAIDRGGDLEGYLDERAPHAAVARSALAQRQDRPSRLPSFAVPEERRSADVVLATDEQAFRLTSRPLRSVSVRNYKMLRRLDLDFPDVPDKYAPWSVLLGVNASGKSTLLQAVALALAGAQEASHVLRPDEALTSGQTEGSVTLEFWDSDQPVELLFTRGAERFTGTQLPSAMVLAYGALRHAGSRRSSGPPEPRFVSVRSLFKPISHIPHPARWLRQADDMQFGVAARALREILMVGDEVEIERHRGSVRFRLGDHVSPLSRMSAGYQTVVAVAADIMRLLMERWQALESATAIVLVDELDAHLHPRWKMRIVRSLRDAFPSVQFIASTHDPLLLRGLRNGEVALLRRDPDAGAVADRDLPPIEGMQVDELLTSRHFGLDSTLDPDTEALFDEYYHLLSLPSDAGVKRRIDELRIRLGDKESLGRNQRENAMLAAARAFIAAPAPIGEVERALKTGTVSRLQAILDGTRAARDASRP